MYHNVIIRSWVKSVGWRNTEIIGGYDLQTKTTESIASNPNNRLSYLAMNLIQV